MHAARALAVSLLAAVVLAVAPSVAGAATASVTGDDGNPTPLSSSAPIAIRNMDVHTDTTLANNEAAYYTTQVLDPAGALASAVSACNQTRLAPSSRNLVAYHGDGTYTLLVRRFNGSSCSRATGEQDFQYAVGAFTSIAAPAGPLLTRAKNGISPLSHPLAVAPNPGATSYEVRYARDATLGPDGGIAGLSAEAVLDRATGLADFLFTEPGAYVLVARAKSGDFFTPWSAPVSATVLAPFDLAYTTFPDLRGPTYAVRGKLREKFAAGRVSLSEARGRKGGRFRRVGRAKIDAAKGRFTVRFTLHRPGLYRLRYVYRGSALVAPGTVTELVRIRRTIQAR
jgi:hypothetical protein